MLRWTRGAPLAQWAAITLRSSSPQQTIKATRNLRASSSVLTQWTASIPPVAACFIGNQVRWASSTSERPKKHVDTATKAEKAMEKAKKYLEDNKIPDAVRFFHIAAHNNNAEAQYWLGTLLIQEEDGEDDDEPALKTRFKTDVEEEKQRLASNADEPQDLQEIRKRARKAYRAYLKAQRQKDMQRANEAKAKAAAPLGVVVQRTTKETLDRSFGVTLQQLLDPATPIRSLADVQREEHNDLKSTGDSTTGVEWLRRAAANGYRDAIVYLGNVCQEQEPPLIEHALTWYHQLAPPNEEKNPHPAALFNIGSILYYGSEDAEPPLNPQPIAALPYFVLAGEHGDLDATFFLGQLLHEGDASSGIQADPKNALKILHEAAEAGHSRALYYFARLYRHGDPASDIVADRVTFRDYLQKALEAEDADAMCCMGDLYYHGEEGFERNLEQAQLFYAAASQEGSTEAMVALGTLYFHGEGVDQDYEAAFSLYQEAAENDSMEAWKNLADMHARGLGVPKNPEMAKGIFDMLEKMASDDDAEEVEKKEE